MTHNGGAASFTIGSNSGAGGTPCHLRGPKETFCRQLPAWGWPPSETRVFEKLGRDLGRAVLVESLGVHSWRKEGGGTLKPISGGGRTTYRASQHGELSRGGRSLQPDRIIPCPRNTPAGRRSPSPEASGSGPGPGTAGRLARKAHGRPRSCGRTWRWSWPWWPGPKTALAPCPFRVRPAWPGLAYPDATLFQPMPPPLIHPATGDRRPCPSARSLGSLPLAPSPRPRPAKRPQPWQRNGCPGFRMPAQAKEVSGGN